MYKKPITNHEAKNLAQLDVMELIPMIDLCENVMNLKLLRTFERETYNRENVIELVNQRINNIQNLLGDDTWK